MAIVYPKSKMCSLKPNFEQDDLFTSAPRVTVKFKLAQDKIFTLPFTIETSTYTIKEQLACILKIPTSDLSLSRDSVAISDEETLADFATAKCGTIIMNLHTSHYIDLNALAKQIYGDIAMRDVISVTVDLGEGKEPEHILVEIIKENLEKAFIGGYRHRLNGKEYHHVSSQTSLLSKSDVVRYERDAQTALDTASKLEGTYGTKSTQTPVKGLYLIEPLNIELPSREYISAKETKEKALVLKKYWRRWILRTKMKSDKFGIKETLEAGEIQYSDEQFMLETRPSSFHSDQRGKIDNFNCEMNNSEEVSKMFTGTLKTNFGKYILKKEIEQLLAKEENRRTELKVLQEQHNLSMIRKFQSGGLRQKKSQVFACKYCKRVKLQSSFRGKSNINGANVCTSCFWLENMSRRRVDYAVYRSILLSIRREEEKYHCLFSVAFVMQEEDIHYIVNTIWHGKSILSETKDVRFLQLCRFDNSIAWSPWNCFLITEKEMRAHLLVDDPMEVYGSWLFEQVRTKHLMARLHFQHLWNKHSRPIQRKDWKRIKKSHNMLHIS